MGLMKEFLMDKTKELAGILDMPEERFYVDKDLEAMALNYASYKLGVENQVREEIKRAILSRLDEVVDNIQKLLTDCDGICSCCEYGYLCFISTQYR